MQAGENINDRAPIKCGKQKGGKLDGPIQCYYAKHFTLRPIRIYFVRILVYPQKIPRHLGNGANGVTWRPSN